jgi:glycosyltransferase involved in cell wall biosynthesis
MPLPLPVSPIASPRATPPPAPGPRPARVAILMGTRDGARFLPAQLATIAAQSHRDWRLVASDDGSTDATRAVLAAFRAEVGAERVEIRKGPARGFAANFLALAGDPAIGADFYAFADQDDLWHPDRLARGLAHLAALPEGRPGLAGGRTRLIDEADAPLGLSPVFRLPPSFENALVQSIAGGNTMLFNAAAKRLFEAVPDVAVVAHDWWAYQLVSGAGGTVVYDPEPFVSYRQHRGNLIGGNQGVRAQAARLRMLLAGKLAEWTDTNLAALAAAAPVLTPEARGKAALLARFRGRGLRGRIALMRELALYRQTRAGTASLWLATVARLL